MDSMVVGLGDLKERMNQCFDPEHSSRLVQLNLAGQESCLAHASRTEALCSTVRPFSACTCFSSPCAPASSAAADSLAVAAVPASCSAATTSFAVLLWQTVSSPQ